MGEDDDLDASARGIALDRCLGFGYLLGGMYHQWRARLSLA